MKNRQMAYYPNPDRKGAGGGRMRQPLSDGRGSDRDRPPQRWITTPVIGTRANCLEPRLSPAV